MEKTCTVCGDTFEHGGGRGRPPTRCVPCRKTNKRGKVAKTKEEQPTEQTVQATEEPQAEQTLRLFPQTESDDEYTSFN